jgi:hypothetical protein
MNWTELLKSEAESVYNATEALMDLVDEDKLDWKPETGDAWMPTGELVLHLTNACGWCSAHFANGTWADVMVGKAPPPPTAEDGVAGAKRLLAADKALTMELIDQAGEEALASKMLAAPWDPTERPLGQHILGMIAHLGQHKGQLFYYLKLQGKPVNTWTLYGLPEPPDGPPA